MRVARSLALASVSVDIVVYAAYVPLAFVVYDSLIVPIVTRVRTSGAISPTALAWAVVITAITLPLLVARDLIGVNINSVCSPHIAHLT